jgi:hypothetical protein
MYSVAISKSMFLIPSRSLRTPRACRLKPIPGSHAGIYLTQKEGELSCKAEQGRIRQKERTTYGQGKSPQLESLGYHLQRFPPPQFQKFGRICRQFY